MFLVLISDVDTGTEHLHWENNHLMILTCINTKGGQYGSKDDHVIYVALAIYTEVYHHFTETSIDTQFP